MGTAAASPEDAYRALFANQPPTGWETLRAAAIRDLAFPRRDEAWRFTPSRKLLGAVHAPQAALGPLPDGVLGLDQADRAALIHLFKLGTDQGFFGLNAAFFDEGAVIHAAEGVQLDPVQLPLTHRGLSTPRVLVVAEAGARIELCLVHTLYGGLAVPVVEVMAQDGAQVALTQVVRGEGDLVGLLAVGLGEQAQVSTQTLIRAQAGTVRLELRSTLGPGSALRTSGLALVRGSAHVDQHLHLIHGADGAHSSQVFRNILDGTSRAVFTGQVDVSPDVRGSDAAQSVSSLLLADGPSVVTRPWLEIHNDDVKASHGATVGRLDPEALFYLRARGIDPAEASRLLTRAFAGEVVATVPEPFRGLLQAEVDGWLGGAAQ